MVDNVKTNPVAISPEPMTLDSFYNTPDSEIAKHINDMAYKTEAVNLLKLKCQKEDFEYYRINHFENKTKEEIDQIIVHVANQQVYCIKNMKKFHKVWLDKPENQLSPADQYLLKALKKTGEKVLVDRKILEVIQNLDKPVNKETQNLNNKNLSMYVYGSQFMKTDATKAWIAYDGKKTETEIIKSSNYGTYFMGALLLLTLYVVFLKKNAPKIVYEEHLKPENDQTSSSNDRKIEKDEDLS